ncbi:MAG TPA: carboxypeptidase-like regulatory domain-containing protein [Longimicrobium sp.]|nr:carboxypeptidase-like regulatory domain-containing protein [Longimicrobium sp.]
MANRHRTLGGFLPFFVVALLGACSTARLPALDEALGVGTPGEAGGLGGRVLDTAGRPIAGAQVRIAGGPGTTTGTAGEYRFPAVRPSPRLALSASADGHAAVVEHAAVSPAWETRHDVVLAPLDSAAFTAEQGATLSLPGGGSVTIQPNTLLRRDGRPAAGAVRALWAFLDPRDDARLIAGPGDLTLDTGAGAMPLVSGGMLRLELTDARGHPLELDGGRPAELRVPAELSRRPGPRADSLPATGLYRFDDATGRWVWVRGLRMDAARRQLTVPLTGLREWVGLNRPELATCVEVVVRTAAGLTRPNTAVDAFGADYNGHTRGHTDASGRVRLLARQNATVRISAEGRSVTVATSAAATPCADAGVLVV